MSERKKQSDYQAKYDKEHMKQYSVKYPIRIYNAVEKAMQESGMNRNKWTTVAILEKLERDGFILEEKEEEKGTEQRTEEMQE